MTQLILWTAAFLVPACSFAVPVPHAPYVLIPALAAVSGFHDRHAVRRIVLWTGLTVLYELVYQIPAGMLAVPVLAMVALHMLSSKAIRMESGTSARHMSVSRFARSYAGAMIWACGLVLLSSLWGHVVAGMPSLSRAGLFTVWWHHGTLAVAAVAIAAAMIVLYEERRSRVRFIFSDHAVVQTQNIPD